MRCKEKDAGLRSDGKKLAENVAGRKVIPPYGRERRFDRKLLSGGGEIRTLERLATSPVFKTGAIGRSATPPDS